MKEKSLKSYGEKTDKSMKTVMRLLRVAHILNNKTELFYQNILLHLINLKF